MHKLLLALLALTSNFVFAASAININQSLSTQYYLKTVMNIHLGVFEKGLNAELKKYDCLQSSMDAKITKEAKSRIFGNDEEGKVKINVTTKCYSPRLNAIQFSISGFGYDEDYTQFNVKFITTTDQRIVKFCAYGLHNDIRKCPDFGDYKPVFSSDLESSRF